jgi:hypothetical protein
MTFTLEFFDASIFLYVEFAGFMQKAIQIEGM